MLPGIVIVKLETCSLNVLLATDGSASAENAAKMLLMLPLPPKTRVLMVTVLREPVRPADLRQPDVWDRMMQQLHLLEHAAATDLLIQTKAPLLADGLARREVSVDTQVLEGNITQEIVAAAETFDADFIALGSRGLSGILAILLGSVARRVVEPAPRPVLVVRPAPYGLRRVLLAVDGSPCSREAVQVLEKSPSPAENEVVALSVAQHIRVPLVELLPLFQRRVRQNVAEVEQAELEIAQRFVEEAKLSLLEAGRKVKKWR